MFGKGEQHHGWCMRAGHVIHQQHISKYLEKQIFVACKNHSIKFVEYDITAYN